MSPTSSVNSSALLVPPVVYAGPTISDAAVRKLLPEAEVKPPIRRGDLYRDRTLRHSVFLIIDGVFRQHEALPVREVVDVLQDDGLVFGASSLGALRAAECWPAGMRGIGSIYRMFRRGILESDEEVAVSFVPGLPRFSSIPLINIRFALKQAIRRHRLTQPQVDRLLECARDTYYADRNWAHLLREAEVPDRNGRLEEWLGSCDLKRKDAQTALRRLATHLARSPEACMRPRASRSPFVPTESHRERPYAALHAGPTAEVMGSLAGYLLASGRHRSVLTRPIELHRYSTEFESVVREIWADLSENNELDAAVFRWRAISAAEREAARLGLTLRRSDLEHAELEIIRSHGHASWQDLEAALKGLPGLLDLTTAHRTSLAWAKRLRASLFS